MKFTIHSDRIDWSTIETAADVTRFILGPDPDYYLTTKHAPGRRRDALVALEASILRKYSYTEQHWSGSDNFGMPLYVHFLRLIRLMFPLTDITPTLADAVEIFCRQKELGRRGLNLIGSQSSSKSASVARIVFACHMIEPKFTSTSIANPQDSAADSAIWGDVLALWNELRAEFPLDNEKATGCRLFPEGREYATKALHLNPGQAKAGRVEISGVKNAASTYKGRKSLKEGRLIKGLMLSVVDEVNEIHNDSYLQVLPNIMSQTNFFMLTTQNYKGPTDMGGQLVEPEGGFDSLNIDRDHIWMSPRFRTITLRFDGHRGPNILAGKVIYPYLLTKDDIDRVAENGGDKSPVYMSQIRSFPTSGDDAWVLLPQGYVTSSWHEDPHYIMDTWDGEVSFCDPAFGGRDSAVYGRLRYGTGVVRDANAQPVPMTLFVIPERFQTIPLDKELRWSRNFAHSLGIAYPGDIEEGTPVRLEDQVALFCRKQNEMHGISATHFGYDFSMRDVIVNSMSRWVGANAKSFNYTQPPGETYIARLKGKAKDVCKNRVTELGFLLAEMFRAKQIRTGGMIESAIIQSVRTKYEMVSGKALVEDKLAYKKRYSNQSPDARDVLMGLVGMVTALGRPVGQVQHKVTPVADRRVLNAPKTVVRHLKHAKGKKLVAGWRR